MDRRAQHILFHTVALYLEQGQPVSSAAVRGRLGGERVSSATIRTVMGRLEAAGLLQQPHPSAGRIPTERGLRLYLDQGVAPRLHPWDRSRLTAAAEKAAPATFPADLGQSLAGLSGQMAVVAVRRFLGSTVREVGLTRCDAGRFLAYFISPGGLVQQKLVEVDFDLTVEEVGWIQNYLNDLLADRSLSEVREIIRQELDDERATRDALRNAALAIGLRALPKPEMELHVEGASHLAAQPEFADLRKLRSLLEAVEERHALLQVLQRVVDTEGVQVMLGSEHHVAGVDGLACVGGSYVEPAGGSTAAITVLGPARMDYGRLVPLVGYATELFGKYWERL